MDAIFFSQFSIGNVAFLVPPANFSYLIVGQHEGCVALPPPWFVLGRPIERSRSIHRLLMQTPLEVREVVVQRIQILMASLWKALRIWQKCQCEKAMKVWPIRHTIVNECYRDVSRRGYEVLNSLWRPTFVGPHSACRCDVVIREPWYWVLTSWIGISTHLRKIGRHHKSSNDAVHILRSAFG